MLMKNRFNPCNLAGSFLLILFVACAPKKGRDILWNIVSECVDRSAKDYCTRCSIPREDSPCADGKSCEKSVSVWKETPEFVVIRDIKMCGCPTNFVHGLALPRSRITGVEDPAKPNSIWQFAWEEAEKRIHDTSEVALVVNPPHARTQDQLHVHIVRLLPGIRTQFKKERTAVVKSFDDVWSVSAKTAAAFHMTEYGVLVAKDINGTILVVIDEQSPERLYTKWRCN